MDKHSEIIRHIFDETKGSPQSPLNVSSKVEQNYEQSILKPSAIPLEKIRVLTGDRITLYQNIVRIHVGIDSPFIQIKFIEDDRLKTATFRRDKSNVQLSLYTSSQKPVSNLNSTIQ